MPVLVLAEVAPDGRRLAPATLPAITAARRISPDVFVLVAGDDVADCARQAAGLADIAGVLTAQAPHLGRRLPENLGPVVAGLVRGRGFGAVVAAANAFGKNVLPRVAALLDVAALTDVTAILAPDVFERPIHAGAAIATVRATDPVRVVTVRPTAFAPAAFRRDAAEGDIGGDAPVSAIDPGTDTGLSRFVGQELVVSRRPDLTQAKVVVAGGRALNSVENFALIERLADALGGAVGATRAAVDAGFAGNALQVGQTGKVVAPELYIGVGLSGAIQHIAGMKDSKIVVAINKDEEAPIFQVADYVLVADLFEAVPALTEALEQTAK